MAYTRSPWAATLTLSSSLPPRLVENLKIQLDRVDIGNVLLRFPAHQLAGLRFLYPFSLDALDDDVAATDCGDHRLRIATDGLNGRADDIRNEMGIHHFAIDDRIVG